MQGNRNSRTEVIFQPVPTDQVGRSLKAIPRGALTGLRRGPGLQVAPQGAPKVVLGVMSLSPLTAECRGAQPCGSCRNISLPPALLSPASEQLWGRLTKHIPAVFWALILGSTAEAQLQHVPVLPRQQDLFFCGHHDGLTHLYSED